MAVTLSTTAKTLQRARQIQTRVRVATQTYAVAYRVIGSLLIAGTLDMLWPLTNVVRGLFMLALVGYLVSQAFGSRLPKILRRNKSAAPESPGTEDNWEAQVARAIEMQRPELDNALIHAVQFGATHDEDPMATALIQRELARAEREAANLPVEQVISRGAMDRGKRILLGVVGSLLLTALLFPRVYRFELPRFFAFWQDQPPFTLTDFTVLPGDARVRSGENLTLTIKVGGLLPERLELVSERSGEKPQAAPLAVGPNGEYTAQLDNLRRDTAFYVSGNTGRSRRYAIEVDAAPRLRKLEVTVQPPAYTKQQAATSELTPGGEIRGLAGSQVSVLVQADQTLSGGELVLTRQDMTPRKAALTPDLKTPTNATASFTLERDGAFRITLQSGGGSLKTPDAAQGKIVLIHDEKPLVTFLAPGQNVIAKADQVVPIVIEAVDDAALQRLEFHQIKNKGKDTAETIDLPGAPREFRHVSRFDLKAMGAKPGDVIEYYATAYDNDPQGVHNTDSDRYWVWVVSEEDYQKVVAKQRGPQEMIAQYRAQTEALRSLAEQQAQLAKEMEQNAEQSRKAQASGNRQAMEQAQQKTQELRQRQRDLKTQAQDAARQMREVANQPAQFDIEKGLQTKLKEMARAVEQAQQPMQIAANASSPGRMPTPAQQAAQQLQRAADKSGAKVEKSLDALEKTLPLFHDLARLQAVAKEQAKVAQQAQQVQEALKKGKSDEFTRSRLKSLAEQQAQLRETLAQIQQDLKDHAQQAQSAAPDAARTANQIADALQQMNVGQTMQQATHAMETQDAAQGAEQSEQARKALESLMGQSEQGKKSAQGACNSQSQQQLGMGAGNCLGQMSQQMGLGMPGQGKGQSQGQGQGQGNSSGQSDGQGAQGQSGGYSAPTPGSRPGDGNNNGSDPQQQAMAMTLTQQPTSGTKPRENKKQPGGERIGVISNDNLEKPTGDKPLALPKATDRAASRYPAEYRRLVQDYFKSVSGKCPHPRPLSRKREKGRG